MFDRRAVIHQHEQRPWTVKLPLTIDPRYHDQRCCSTSTVW
jgi:hypothetical protein